jgi:hypothetical protein
MNKKPFAIFLIPLGGYLLVGNTILSIFFNYAGPIGFYGPISPMNYWVGWFELYGPMTIFIAMIGIVLIIYGISLLKRNQGLSEKSNKELVESILM